MDTSCYLYQQKGKTNIILPKGKKDTMGVTFPIAMTQTQTSRVARCCAINMKKELKLKKANCSVQNNM